MRVRIERKAFGATAILRDVAFDIAPGETLALTGPSGIGKSTVVRIAAGLDTDFAGSVGGAGRISIVFQEPTLLPWRSVLDNLVLPTGCGAQTARALLASVGLEGLEARFPGTLSLGQARRVALARAFAVEPDTLFLDEAFASLDREAAEQMHRLLLSLLARRRTRVLLVTHDPRDAARLADRALLLGGSPASVLRRLAFDNRPGQRSAAEMDAAIRAMAGG